MEDRKENEPYNNKKKKMLLHLFGFGVIHSFKQIQRAISARQ